MARSAGAYAQLVAREGKYAILRLPSGETRMVLVTCLATIGVVTNSERGLERSGKAGVQDGLDVVQELEVLQ